VGGADGSSPATDSDGPAGRTGVARPAEDQTLKHRNGAGDRLDFVIHSPRRDRDRLRASRRVSGIWWLARAGHAGPVVRARWNWLALHCSRLQGAVSAWDQFTRRQPGDPSSVWGARSARVRATVAGPPPPSGRAWRAGSLWHRDGRRSPRNCPQGAGPLRTREAVGRPEIGFAGANPRVFGGVRRPPRGRVSLLRASQRTTLEGEWYDQERSWAEQIASRNGTGRASQPRQVVETVHRRRVADRACRRG